LIFYDRTGIERLEMRRRDFMSAVSHELKTPLTSILGFAETALEDEAIDIETTRNFFERIVHHAERLSLLVRDIITLSRLEEGEWAIRPEDVDLVRLAADLVDDIQDAAGKSRVSLVLQAPPKMPAFIDPELIRMLLSNLMSNAIRYNRPDGTVWVRLSEDPGARLRLEVQDTGIGIPPEHQERIFERFYRVDSHRSRQSGGTGLGLSIVKHLLQRLGGRLELQSSSAGTRFVILLPYVHAGTGEEVSGQAGPRR
jgi:two-component system, OmpR family, phosphate regulon sensor histidine kinase PhoR